MLPIPYTIISLRGAVSDLFFLTQVDNIAHLNTTGPWRSIGHRSICYPSCNTISCRSSLDSRHRSPGNSSHCLQSSSLFRSRDSPLLEDPVVEFESQSGGLFRELVFVLPTSRRSGFSLYCREEFLFRERELQSQNYLGHIAPNAALEQAS